MAKKRTGVFDVQKQIIDPEYVFNYLRGICQLYTDTTFTMDKKNVVTMSIEKAKIKIHFELTHEEKYITSLRFKYPNKIQNLTFVHDAVHSAIGEIIGSAASHIFEYNKKGGRRDVWYFVQSYKEDKRSYNTLVYKKRQKEGAFKKLFDDNTKKANIKLADAIKKKEVKK